MECLDAAIAKVNTSCPEVLRSVDIGIEEVPVAVVQWSPESIPLAAAVEATDGRPAQIVIYRRPLEHRAASRSGLRILVHRTLVEQLAALTGLSTSEIDPFSEPEEEW